MRGEGEVMRVGMGEVMGGECEGGGLWSGGKVEKYDTT